MSVFKYIRTLQKGEVQFMFAQGDLVMYGIHGVCRVIAKEIRKLSKKKMEYYVMESVDQPGTQYFVPTQNKNAVAKMRKMMTKEELNTLLRSEKAHEDTWIADENERKQYYRDLITTADHAGMVATIETLYRKKEQQEACGRKFHQCDENFLRNAEKMLVGEFALILHIDHEEVGPYVQEVMSAS